MYLRGLKSRPFKSVVSLLKATDLSKARPNKISILKGPPFCSPPPKVRPRGPVNCFGGVHRNRKFTFEGLLLDL